MSLAFEQRGEGKAFVLLHGNYASTRWWKNYLETPLPGWARYAPLLPGFAGSPALPQTTVEALADSVEGFIAEHRLERPVLLGHSLTGSVALEMASRHPEAYSGLILLSSAPLTGYPHNPDADAIRAQIPHNRALLTQLFTLQSPGLPLERRESVDWEGILDDAQALPPSVGNGAAAALGAWDISARAEKLQSIPTLILAGELDPLVTPERSAALHATLPKAALELRSGVGHWFALEQPEFFTARVAAFLKGLS